jgi:hypothetical protein
MSIADRQGTDRLMHEALHDGNGGVEGQQLGGDPEQASTIAARWCGPQ